MIHVVASPSATFWLFWLCTWQPQTHWKCQLPHPWTNSFLEHDLNWRKQTASSLLEPTVSVLTTLTARRSVSLFCSRNHRLYLKWTDNEVCSNCRLLLALVLPASQRWCRRAQTSLVPSVRVVRKQLAFPRLLTFEGRHEQPEENQDPWSASLFWKLGWRLW